jgi:hypothetical protein
MNEEHLETIAVFYQCFKARSEIGVTEMRVIESVVDNGTARFRFQ